MFLKFLSIFLVNIFFFNSLIAQNLFFGKVIDSANSHPVSYAIVRTNSTGTYCDSAGNFILKGILDDSAFISCVGYKEKKISIKKNKDDLIILVPLYNNLTPVILGEYAWLKNTQKQIGKLNGSSKFSIFVPQSGLTLVKYFSHPDRLKKYIIAELVIRIGINSSEYKPRKVRIRILEASDSISAGNDLLNYPDIFYLNKIKGDLAYLDLNAFAFEMPFKGCYIGIEFIGSDESSIQTKENLNLKGWLSKDYEDGRVLSKYFSNSFHDLTFGSKQKANLYFSINIFETK